MVLSYPQVLPEGNQMFYVFYEKILARNEP